VKIPKIKSIKIQKRRKNRRTITLENGDVFGISEDVYASEKLAVGQALSPQKIIRIKGAEITNQAYNSALHLLSYRMRSKSEMNTRLARKGYDQKVIGDTINRLIEKHYLDDEEFARIFARDKIKLKKIGPFALRSELSVHHIDPEIIERTIEEIYNQFPVKELIIGHVAKIKKSSELSPKIKKRLVATLRRKGFSWDQIQNALNFNEN
jgi:regulatory protein